MKSRFVNDVERITWLYKLSADTLNLAADEQMPEVEVMVAQLKHPDCPTELFSFIDEHMPHHLVFVLLHEGNAMLLVNYKEWTDATHTRCRIRQSFATLWMPVEELSLPIQGLALSRIYDNFVASISGIGQHQSGNLAEIVALRQRIDKKEAEIKTLQNKIRKEPQFNRQMELNQQLKVLRKELEAMNNELALWSL